MLPGSGVYPIQSGPAQKTQERAPGGRVPLRWRSTALFGTHRFYYGDACQRRVGGRFVFHCFVGTVVGLYMAGGDGCKKKGFSQAPFYDDPELRARLIGHYAAPLEMGAGAALSSRAHGCLCCCGRAGLGTQLAVCRIYYL